MTPAHGDGRRRLLASGAVVALPTDTVYGVAAAISHPGAVVRLFALKDRDAAKPVAVLVADLGPGRRRSPRCRRATRAIADGSGPERSRSSLPRADGFDVDLGGAGHTVGVRCPGTRRADRCSAAGSGRWPPPSANRSGHPTPADGAGVANELGGHRGGAGARRRAGARAERASTVVRVDGSTSCTCCAPARSRWGNSMRALGGVRRIAGRGPWRRVRSHGVLEEAQREHGLARRASRSSRASAPRSSAASLSSSTEVEVEPAARS